MRFIEREYMDYVPFYCEENVWRLLRREELAAAQAWALIVSNAERRVVFMRQRSGRPVDGLVQWDYHVLALVGEGTEGYFALDLDSEAAVSLSPGSVSRSQLPRRGLAGFGAALPRDHGRGLCRESRLRPLPHAATRRFLYGSASSLGSSRSREGIEKQSHGMGGDGLEAAGADLESRLSAFDRDLGPECGAPPAG